MMIIGVIGTGESHPVTDRVAEEVGREIGRLPGAVLVNGGLGGVMEASARGAKRAGGITVGILPGYRPEDANPYIDIPLPTGMGEMRNFLIVRASQVLIAVGGGFGTLSEIAIALKMGRKVIGIDTWKVSDEIDTARDGKEAVEKAVRYIERKGF